MSRLSNESKFGSIPIAVHWLSAVLIVALLTTGLIADWSSDQHDKATLLSFHVPMGLMVLALTLFRLVWWWRVDRKPASLPMPHWQNRIAHATHRLFYVVILVMVASGIAMLVFSGAAPIIFGAAPGELPDFRDFAPRGPHGIGAVALLALLVLHAGAALQHHFIKRDGLLSRMWFGNN